MKKGELRHLVGERHRDIIDASDRICEMKDLSFKVISHFNMFRYLKR